MILVLRAISILRPIDLGLVGGFLGVGFLVTRRFSVCDLCVDECITSAEAGF